MKNQTLLLVLLVGLFNFNVFAQPANDGCAGAINIGSLPTPGACTAGLQNGAITTVTGTTVAATADNPFIFQNGCQGSALNMNAPSIDVWYKFTATGTTFNLNLTGFPNANVALWSGTCGNLGGYACSIGTAGGTTTLVATQIQIGSTYYISISGNTDTQTSTFTLKVDNDIDCNNCMRQSNITANPMPVNGAYSPGQTVQFCYQVTQWEVQNTNWFHGVQISMGSGWTGAITATTPAATCGGTSGTWVYKPTGIGVVNGTTWGPGFYFEDGGSATNPADNFGDYCFGTGLNWTFCFTLTVNPACTPGSDLGVDINTSGDGESGSWSSTGCIGDNPTAFNAIGTCCPPTMTSTPTCINVTTGTATATPLAGSAAPFTYLWTPGNQTTQTATGLAPGTYTVALTDANLCQRFATVVVASNPLPAAPTSAPITYCINAATVPLTATLTGGCTTLNWYGTNATGGTASSTGPTPTSVVAGTTTYYVSQTSALGCEGPRATLVVTINPLPIVTVNSPTICAGATAVLTAAGATTYSWTPSSSTANPYSVTPTVTTSYTVTGTLLGCVGTAISTVTVNPLPIITVNSPTICPTLTAVLTASGATTYSWSPGGSTANPLSVTPLSTTTYTVTGTTLGCVGTATATVTVSNSLTVTVNSQTICAGSTAVLTASGGTTYDWDAGTSTLNPYSVTPNVTTSYNVTGTSNGCTGTAIATVTVSPMPLIPITLPVTYCENAVTVPLTATASGTNTLNWYGTNATNGTASTTAPTPSSAIVGTTTYYVSQSTIGGCEGPRTTLVVTVIALPIVTVNSPTICPTTSATLTATGATTYSWNPGLSTANPLVVSPLVNTIYTVTGTTLGCVGTATATVTILNALVITVNSPSICLGGTAVLTATGGTTYDWDSGTSTLNPYSVTPLITTTYTVIGTTNGCTGTATATVTVNPLPVAPLTTPVQYCQNDIPVALIASALVGNNLNWYGTNVTGGTASSIAPTPSTSIAGTTTYYVSQTVISAGCEGPRATLIVTIDPLPVAPVTAPIEYCLNDATSPLNVTPLAGNTLNWYGSNPTVGVPSSITPTPSSSVATTTIYYVSQTNSLTGCEGPRAALLVTINPLPLAPSTLPIIYCINDVASPLNASESMTSTGTPYILNWYGINITGGTSSSTAPTPSTSLAITTIYYVSQTNPVTGCEGPRAAISVTVNSLITPLFTQINSVCEGVTPPVFVVTSSNFISGTWSPTINTSVIGTTLYTFTPNINQCASPTTMSITINPNPVLQITDPLPVCFPETVDITALGITTGSNGNGTLSYWTDQACTNSLLNPTSISSSNTYFIQSTSLTGCVDIDAVNVIVNSLPIASFVPTPVELTGLNSNSTMVNNSINAVTYSWDFGDGETSILTSPTHEFPGEMGGSYTITLTATSEFGCVDQAVANVNVKEELIYYVPNTFTPDHDTYNETFLPIFTSGYDPYDYTLYIFNRWGELIFESHDAKIGWIGNYGATGEMVQEGTYTWKIDFKLKNATERQIIVGHVNILK